MPQLPEPNISTRKQIFEAYEADQEDPNRAHLGASLIGRECLRQCWYTFRWAAGGGKLEGRRLRIFERGDIEEERVAKNLRRIGVNLQTHQSDGSQFRKYILGGHFGGACDGFGLGFPEAPKTWHVWECKTWNTKDFTALVKKGVKEAKPAHYDQMQVYMGMWGLHDAFYTAVDKNDEDIHVERVKWDKLHYDGLVMKAKRIVFSDTPPARPYRDQSFYQCKMCEYSDICWGTQLPQVTCRSCVHSTPLGDDAGGGWSCAQHPGAKIPLEFQKQACPSHRYIPIFMENFARPKNACDKQNWVQYELKPEFGGGTFVNGPNPGMSSIELSHVQQKQLLGEPAIEAIKADFPNARLIG